MYSFFLITAMLLLDRLFVGLRSLLAYLSSKTISLETNIMCDFHMSNCVLQNTLMFSESSAPTRVIYGRN